MIRDFKKFIIIIINTNQQSGKKNRAKGFIFVGSFKMF